LIDLHKKGVKVRIITDDDQSASNGSDVQRMRKEGIPIEMDSTPYHMHNKFAVIDGVLLLNGSYNWTTTANTKNNENMIVTNNKSLVQQFSSQFENLWKEFSKNKK
jgi:mitochondrial cardiolipin hydrolase